MFDYLCTSTFFSSDLSVKVKFLKTLRTIFYKRHSTPKGAPACAKFSIYLEFPVEMKCLTYQYF